MTAVWAHRGWAARVRENTLDAFRAARTSGADGVELDVRTTVDGVLVVHHDPALEDGRAIAETPAAELPEWLPTLEAALAACDGLTVDIEVKNLPIEIGYDPDEGTAIATARMAAALGGAGRLVISAFAMAAIDAARATAPHITTGWLTLAAYDQLEALELAAARGHRALHPRHEAVTPELVMAAHLRGLAVHAWTTDDGGEVRRLSDAGVDAVMTNRPDIALAALGRRSRP
ncbi:MAG TPA: glycerophosphodiester phosphodiesterase [Acidimicrobiales bacterium]|nr:glycerophosphodiester phosphodiesterase [Acidimicrobiales bacterium]